MGRKSNTVTASSEKGPVGAEASQQKPSRDGSIEFTVNNQWYRVSDQWARTKHPGGEHVLELMAGRDATDAFFAMHPQGTEKLLRAFAMSKEENEKMHQDARSPQVTPVQRGFRDMLKQLEEDGQLVTEPLFYVRILLWLVSLLSSAIGGVVILNMYQATLTVTMQWLLVIGSASILGLFWQQLAFAGHDIGHNTVMGTQNRDRFLAWVVTALFGASIQWWKANHNVHHIVTNLIEDDPDVQHMPIMCLDSRALDGYYSSFKQRSFKLDEIGRFFISHQHLLFYPIMSLARINLYVESVMYIFSHPIQYRKVEIFAMGMFWVWFITLVSAVHSATSSWLLTAAFVFVSHAVAGVTHVQITLSHFERPLVKGGPVNGVADPDVSHDVNCWIENAVHTSLDIICDAWFDWFHGGLQFQVAHHLIPRVPRHRLRYVNDHYVKPFLKRANLTYNASTFVEANLAVLSVLRNTANSVKVRHEKL